MYHYLPVAFKWQLVVEFVYLKTKALDSMSKKHKKNLEQNFAGSTGSLHAAEYAIVRHDLLRVVVLNVVYLAVILTLYFTDQKSHYLEHWFSKLLHF